MDDKLPRLLLDSEDWPKELDVKRASLSRRANQKSWKTVALISIVAGVITGALWIPTLNGPKWTRMVIFGAVAMANSVALGLVQRRRTRDDVARLLINNGYCVCGYPYQVSGIIRSCPECGRQWTEKSLPKD